MDSDRGTRSTVGGLVRRMGARAEEPRTAAAAVGVPATVFSALYYGSLLTGYTGRVAESQHGPVVDLAVLFVLTVANAVVVSWAVWRQLGPEGAWSYRYGGFCGLCIGLLSHLTLGVVLVLFGTTLGDLAVELTAARFVDDVLFYAAASVVFTAGVPVLVSVGAGLLLTYARKRTGAGRKPAGA